MEDAILEEQEPSDPRHRGENNDIDDKIRKASVFAETSANTSSKKLCDAPPYGTFLVLEVCLFFSPITLNKQYPLFLIV